MEDKTIKNSEDKEFFNNLLSDMGIEFPRLVHSKYETYNVFRVNRFDTWDSDKVDDVLDKIEKFNLKSSVRASVCSFNDYEFDGDRMDKANFEVKFYNKNN